MSATHDSGMSGDRAAVGSPHTYFNTAGTVRGAAVRIDAISTSRSTSPPAPHHRQKNDNDRRFVIVIVRDCAVQHILLTMRPRVGGMAEPSAA